MLSDKHGADKQDLQENISSSDVMATRKFSFYLEENNMLTLQRSTDWSVTVKATRIFSSYLKENVPYQHYKD
jgi:hypothetical protein